MGMGGEDLRELLEAESAYSGNCFFKALARALPISLSLWGVIALGFFLCLRPALIKDGTFMTAVAPVAFCIRDAKERASSPPQSLSTTVS